MLNLDSEKWKHCLEAQILVSPVMKWAFGSPVPKVNPLQRQIKNRRKEPEDDAPGHEEDTFLYC